MRVKEKDRPERDWRSKRTFAPKYWKWAKRARIAGSHLSDSEWVLDIGCGERALRYFLPRSTGYLAADLVQWAPDIEICDLNAGEFPDRYLAVADTSVMLGVIEYLERPKDVFERIAQSSERLLVSYNPTDLFPRRAPHWISHLSSRQLIDMLADASFDVKRASVFDKRRLLLSSVNRSFTTRDRERRNAAQSAMGKPTQSLSTWEILRHRWRTISTYKPGYVTAYPKEPA